LPVDWAAFLRRMERKKRLMARAQDKTPPADYYPHATYSSFRLEGLEVSEQEVWDALGRGDGKSMLRSRQGQRMRNHAAILHHIETDLRDPLPLRCEGVVRWYTGISAGLSTTGLDQAAAARLADVVRRINSPQMRIRAALREIAVTYSGLIAEPLVPAFNGILARLLLRYHLGRCGLPSIIFDPKLDHKTKPVDELGSRIVELLGESFDALLRRGR
jgi:hypothetical protein